MKRHTAEKKDSIQNKKLLAIGVGWGGGILLMGISKLFGGIAEWYSAHIYPLCVRFFGGLSGIFPFSVSELLLYVCLVLLCGSALRLVVRIARKAAEKQEYSKWLINFFLITGILFFLYTVNCGINYNRIPFSELSGITSEEYTAAELKEVCILLTEDVNERSAQVKRGAEDIMILGGTEQKDAVRAMNLLGEVYPELRGYYPEPKGLVFPWILSVQNLTGVYSPFTVEANYNSGMIPYNIPFTICHELSHLRGFMQEEEANFIAYLACMESEQIEFQYSGSLLGWIYSMNVLQKVDPVAYQEVREMLHPLAEADLAENGKFWAEYDGRIAEVSNQVNDTYLKVNGQHDGVKSYDRMVDLLVAYYQGA